ncbi:hypothetical protein LEP1GSC104_0009, partial [Leptospira interrogans str. UI 12621]
AEREIHRRDNLLLGGNPALFLDRKLFSGGLTSLITKGYRGVATTLADVGNMLGEGVVSSAFRDSVYDQTRDWRNTITQEDVKARTGQGIINKSYIETEMRNQLFDVIGETFIPGDKEAAHNLGLLLKHHIDAKRRKETSQRTTSKRRANDSTSSGCGSSDIFQRRHSESRSDRLVEFNVDVGEGSGSNVDEWPGRSDGSEHSGEYGDRRRTERKQWSTSSPRKRNHLDRDAGSEDSGNRLCKLYETPKRKLVNRTA